MAAGVVLTPEWSTSDAATVDMLWQIVSHDGALPLAVRPSPVGVGERGSGRPGRAEGHRPVGGGAGADRMVSGPVAVLVQPVLPDEWRGVLIADDGGTNGTRRRHLVHTATNGGDWIADDRAGRVRRVLAGQHLEHPPVEVLVRLGRLADRVRGRVRRDPRRRVRRPGRSRAALHLRSGVSAYLTEYQFETAASTRSAPALDRRGRRPRRQRRPHRGVVEGSGGEVVGHAAKRAPDLALPAHRPDDLCRAHTVRSARWSSAGVRSRSSPAERAGSAWRSPSASPPPG